MKQTSIHILSAVILSCSSLVAQDTSINDTTEVEKTKALVFTFSGLNLGGGLGGKYVLSHHVFLRASVSGRFQSHRYDDARPDSTPSLTKDTRMQIGWSIDFCYRLEIDKNFSPYLGLGVGSNWEKDENEYASIRSSRTDSYTLYGPNAKIFFGLEYWLTKTISLSGEQSLNFYYIKSTYSTILSLDNSTSALLLSVYF